MALASNVRWSFGTTFDVAMVAQGKEIFRFDTFGDETQWTDTLRMHEVIAQRRRSDDGAVGRA